MTKITLNCWVKFFKQLVFNSYVFHNCLNYMSIDALFTTINGPQRFFFFFTKLVVRRTKKVENRWLSELFNAGSAAASRRVQAVSFCSFFSALYTRLPYLHSFLPGQPQVTPREKARGRVPRDTVNPSLMPQLYHDCVDQRISGLALYEKKP